MDRAKAMEGVMNLEIGTKEPCGGWKQYVLEIYKKNFAKDIIVPSKII